MVGRDGWDGRLSPFDALLRAPYGANNIELPVRRPPIQFRQVSPNSSPAPSSPEPKRANLQKCINQTSLFPSLTVSNESDLCDKNQAAVAALPQLPFPEKCINFADVQTGRVETGLSYYTESTKTLSGFKILKLGMLVFPVLPPCVCLLHFARNHCRGSE